MKSSIQNIIFNKPIFKFINFALISLINLGFVIIIYLLLRYLFTFTADGNYILILIIVMLFSSLPVLNFFLNKLDSYITPSGYNEAYTKTVDSILNSESFDEILFKNFSIVIKLLKSEFGHTIYYHDENDVLDIEYLENETHKIHRREKSETDHVLLKHIKGPDDIIIKSNNKKPSDKEINKVLRTMRIDLIVPIFYNNQVSGIIAIGGKKDFSEREIKLLKIIAFKLALLSSNSYYFHEIRKRREVEKEYELTHRIQKQFLPEPSIKCGNIIIETFHNTASSFTREFHDIFINNAQPDDIRISAYHVFGDVKETSIFMPGVQAILQSYARLGYPPRKTITKLKKFIKERDVLNGDLMLFHSSINQSGEFTCYSSNYPIPFYYQNSLKQLTHFPGKGRGLKYLNFTITPGDIIVIPCSSCYNIIKSGLLQYSQILNIYKSRPLKEIKDILINTINKSINNMPKDKTQDEGNDQLLILIGMEDKN